MKRMIWIGLAALVLAILGVGLFANQIVEFDLVSDVEKTRRLVKK